MKSKYVWIIIIVAVVGIVSFIAYRQVNAKSAAAETLSIETGIVRRGDLTVSIDSTGNIVPRAEVELAFMSGGRMADVLVREGDTVKAGAALARLDTDALEAAVSQAQAGLDVADANLQTAKTQLEMVTIAANADEAAWRESNWTTDLSDEIAQPGWYFDKSEQITAAQTEVNAAWATLDTTHTNLKVVLQTASSGNFIAIEKRLADAQAAFLTAKDLSNQAETSTDAILKEQAQAVLDAAQIELEAAQDEYDQSLTPQAAADVLEARARLTVARVRYDTAINTFNQLLTGDESLEVKAAKDSVKQAEAAVDQAQAALDAANIALNQATLKAPINGVITALFIEPGEMANSGQTVVVVGDLSNLNVEVNVSETDVAQLSEGMEVHASLDAFPANELSGKVTYIEPVATVESGVVLYAVTVSLSTTELPLRSGMTVNLTFPIEQQTDTLIVPFRAVETESGQAYVTRVTDRGTERVSVMLGLITDTQVEILSGLNEGDVVTVYANPAQDTELMSNPMFGGGQ